jgi:hypothetical protein
MAGINSEGAGACTSFGPRILLDERATITADADAISVGNDTEAHFVTADIINHTT